MKIFLCIILCFLSVQLYAQTYNPEKINKKAVKVYEQAVEYLIDGMLQESIPFLQKAIGLDTNYVEAILSLAGVYGQLKKHELSVSYYEWAKRKDTVYFRQYHLPYSINLAGTGKFKEALDAVNYFLSVPKISDNSIKAGNYRKRCFEFALQYSVKHIDTSYVFTPENLGDSINTERSEYYPNVTIDDSLLVFNRRGDGIRENFMQSKIDSNGYRKATLINGSINEEPSKGAITISADGEWLIFAGNFGREKSYGSFDLYISYYTPEGWSEPENLGPNINTEFWESSPSLSPDKRVLYFSSNRYGGVGGKDLYFSERMPNGKFGPAVNMGEGINTEADEFSPFIHADNQTLYFTSNGWQGYGASDLFVVRKQDDNTWSEPENLGYPINTIDDDGYLAVSADGLTAYFASDRSDSRGGLDLYKFKLRKDIRPARTLYVKGKVYDKVTNKGLPCTVELIDNNTGNALMKIQTDELGEYFITLPLGKNYTFTVNRKGYLFYTELYELQNKEADSVYKKDIPLQPIALNSNIVLQNIQFEPNSFKLLPVSLIELNKLLQILNDNPTLQVEISGHTDNTGNAADNVKLSTQRAKAVVDYLVDKGITTNRLTYKGYGASKPIADNKTEQGRAKNRRTECKIVGL
ncbi:MAG: PD40 domain-containing protein [Chitinophagaceae bacterium]|nr:PD40 domain-containing protein [Chitinophagaceae bacterium]MCW5905727.1 PD40 domain-containing protein [Chitinophagaceae bacterium]